MFKLRIHSANITQLPHQKTIAFFQSVFEGIGMAGLISAGCWYTVAPIAPYGFEGPISTLCITISTLTSLVIAIPIGYAAYKRMLHQLTRSQESLSKSLDNYNEMTEQVFFNILKLKCLTPHTQLNIRLKAFYDDFKEDIHQNNLMALVNKMHEIHRQKSYCLKWRGTHSLIPYLIESTDKNSHAFNEWMLDTEASLNPAIRKSLLNRIKLSYLIQNSAGFTMQLKKCFYAVSGYYSFYKVFICGVIAAITSAEVLLSIAWTVGSILIGTHVINPISYLLWGLFALSCMGIGICFGVGVGLSQHQQQKLSSLATKLSVKSERLQLAVQHLQNLISRQMLQGSGRTQKNHFMLQ